MRGVAGQRAGPHGLDLGLVAAVHDLVQPATHGVAEAAGVVQLAVRLVIDLLGDQRLRYERPARAAGCGRVTACGMACRDALRHAASTAQPCMLRPSTHHCPRLHACQGPGAHSQGWHASAQQRHWQFMRHACRSQCATARCMHACRQAGRGAPKGDVLRPHVLGVVGRPGGVAPHGRPADGQHADARAPGPEQAHALVLRDQVVAEERADQAQLCGVPRLPCPEAAAPLGACALSLGEQGQRCWWRL